MEFNKAKDSNDKSNTVTIDATINEYQAIGEDLIESPNDKIDED